MRARHTRFLAVYTQKDQADPPRARRAWLVAASLLTATLLPISAGMAASPTGAAEGPEVPAPALAAAVSPRVQDHPRSAALGARHGLPLIFEANQGQTDPQVKFVSRGRGYTLFLTPDEMVLSLIPQGNAGAMLRMKLLGAHRRPSVAGMEELPGKVNYFIGNDPAQWRTNIPTYAKVKYESVYPGVDLVYYGDGRQLEYDFVVAPGADPKAIALAFEGPDKLEVDAQGDLVIQTAGGELRLRKPLVYQEVDGARKPIAGSYILKSQKQVGFQVAAYDVKRPLVIDPVLAYSTFLGGSSTDEGLGIAVDAAGNAYVTGFTQSSNFPVRPLPPITPQPFDTSIGGNTDAFVTKLDSSGAALFSTYLGGGSVDRGRAIAVDLSGNVYVTGVTQSSNFPSACVINNITCVPFDASSNGSDDAFVIKLNPTGSALLYSTFLGGKNLEDGRGIAVAAGKIYVTGLTTSAGPNNPFPTTTGASGTVQGYDTTQNGGQDAFVAVLNPAGQGSSDLRYSTLLGGSGNEVGNSIAVDTDGKIYVTGFTTSSNFPTVLAFDSSLNGAQDAFVARLDPTLGGTNGLVYSTYLGGGGIESGNGIAVAASKIYVVGSTTSAPSAPFVPTSGTSLGPFQASYAGGQDAFVAVLNPGVGLDYLTYVGGSGTEDGKSIALHADAAGIKIHITGSTTSVRTTFPIPSLLAFQNDLTPGDVGGDAFVARLNPTGSGTDDLVYFVYLGGSKKDVGSGVAVDTFGRAYVVGTTASGVSSTPFPTTPGAFDTSCGTDGSCNAVTDAFVAKLRIAPMAAGQTVSTNEDTAKAITLSGTDVDGDPLTFTIVAGPTHGSLGSVGAASCSVNAGGSSCTASITYTPAPNYNGPDSFTFKVNDGSLDSNTATVAINVLAVNDAPVLDSPGNKIVDEGTLLSFVLSASDVDAGETFTFSISTGFQSGMALNGATFSWTPGENQGPGIYAVTFRVTDSGTLFDEKIINITVNEVNVAPVLGAIGNKIVNEETLLTFTATATDADVPTNTLTFSLANGTTSCGAVTSCVVPEGASINSSTGVFTWTPTEAQGPGTYRFRVVVTDNGSPILSDDEEITVTVNEVNLAPVLGAIGNKSLAEGTQLTFTATATDADVPANTLTFSLASGTTGCGNGIICAVPAGASINDSSGVFTWTPTEAQGPGTYLFKVVVTDNGSPSLSDDEEITVTVTEVNLAPVLGPIGNQSVNEGVLLPFTVTANDADLPGNTLTLSASNLPTGATFTVSQNSPITGTFSWRPTSAQGGPNPYLVDFTVSDGQFSDTRRVSIAVADNIPDADGDGVPDPPGFDLDGNGVISPPEVPNSQGQFEQDNCPDNYNPDQVDVCHNSPEAVTADATATPSGSATTPINVMATFTFNAGATPTSVVPPNRFNVICRVTSNATLQELQWQTVPEGAPIVLSNQPDGDLIPLQSGSNVFVTTFDLRDWYPNLPEGSYTVVCTYVNFAHIPGVPDPLDPTVWMGEANAPPFTIFIGLYAIDSPFFLSPAENQPFNRPRTVPVKFVLRDSTGALVTTATIRLFIRQLPDGSPAPATSKETAGNVVPFDAATNQYHYNLNTEPLASGFWELQAKLDDGTTQVITIEIR